MANISFLGGLGETLTERPSDAANLDDGDLWPVSYALKKWSPVVEKKVVELVNAATS
jgi:hypothetical protein